MEVRLHDLKWSICKSLRKSLHAPSGIYIVNSLFKVAILKPSLLHMALHVSAEFSTVKQPLDASRLARGEKSAPRLLLFTW